MQLVKYFRKYKTFWWAYDIVMIISYEGALFICFVYFTKMHLYLYSAAWGSIREQACDDLLAGARKACYVEAHPQLGPEGPTSCSSGHL